MALTDILKSGAQSTAKFGSDLANALRDSAYGGGASEVMYACAYTLFLAQKSNLESPSEQNILDLTEGNDAIYYYLERTLGATWKHIKTLVGKYSDDTIAAFILSPIEFSRSYEMTPQSLIELSLLILNITDGDSVADFGTGTGAFLLSSCIQHRGATYWGVDINTTMTGLANIKVAVAEANIQINQSDMFKAAKEHGPFDKVFSHYPFGLRLKDVHGGLSYASNLSADYPQLPTSSSADWLFSTLLISSITDSGKAVGIMPVGSTWNGSDKDIREYFVRKGLVEAVISLPPRLFASTMISTALVVFSKGNKTIRMVDATDVYQSGRRMNELTSENIKVIYSALQNESVIGKTVGIDELEKNDFIINPTRYFADSMHIPDGVEFSSVIKSITRGAPLTARQLDETASVEPTRYQYLMLANIKDGFIEKKLPYLTKVEEKLQKYCLKTGDLLLSKNGAPFKVAVASVKDGTTVLANGNLFIITLDESRVNPLYLKAFFESEQGSISLKNISVGAAIPNISLEQLRKLIVPVPDMKTQNELVERYRAKADEIAVLNHRLLKAKTELKNIFVEA